MRAFHRRVRHEQRGDRLLDARRHDEEGVHAAHCAQVLVGHPLHGAGELQQRRGERARATRDDRCAAVGAELAVAREGEHQKKEIT